MTKIQLSQSNHLLNQGAFLRQCYVTKTNTYRMKFLSKYSSGIPKYISNLFWFSTVNFKAISFSTANSYENITIDNKTNVKQLIRIALENFKLDVSIISL